ncbi:hypothetical protein [Tabrizicola sp.]|uniref:hypothetical protein n=1 Tax=Tabrizicola sp. TaxID=2005166 RepID=UPI001A3F5D81|nr:hypothetical protein [Tabrizicola sp.]MBL9062121.1 hypothetical protein [Tabrizicola sp.]
MRHDIHLAASPCPRIGAAPDLPPLKVLVVEDHPVNQDGARGVLAGDFQPVLAGQVDSDDQEAGIGTFSTASAPAQAVSR